MLSERLNLDDLKFERLPWSGARFMMQLKQLIYAAFVCTLISVAIPNSVVALSNEEPGTELRDCETCPLMIVVPSGSYMMGSPASEAGRFDDEGPQHQVAISYPFAVGKFEVTFHEWNACVSEGGCSHSPDDEGWGRGDHPVINVSWDDAREYVTWLSRKTGERYRLLSESEWEYIARAGTTGPFNFGSTISTDRVYDDYPYAEELRANYRNNKTVPVGSFPGNAFGLHDIHGNVWEWVKDCWNGSYKGAPSDGSAWVSSGDCNHRVLRGGSWNNNPWDLRSAIRNWLETGKRNNNYGFRVARTLAP